VNAQGKAGKAAATATSAAAAAKKPQPLTLWESVGAVLLFVAGLALIGLTLYGFANSDSTFSFQSKKVTTTEFSQQSSADGRGAGKPDPEKKTEETDYADTVAVFALTIGAALALAGAFYGRLRSLKLGGLELGLVGEQQMKQAAQKAADDVKRSVPDTSKQPAAEAAAEQVAIADLSRAAALGIKPTDSVVDGIASQAAQKVAQAVR
jgi:hypothetical protein